MLGPVTVPRDLITFRPVGRHDVTIIGTMPRGVEASQELLAAIADYHGQVHRTLTEAEIYALALPLMRAVPV